MEACEGGSPLPVQNIESSVFGQCDFESPLLSIDEQKASPVSRAMAVLASSELQVPSGEAYPHVPMLYVCSILYCELFPFSRRSCDS